MLHYSNKRGGDKIRAASVVSNNELKKTSKSAVLKSAVIGPSRNDSNSSQGKMINDKMKLGENRNEYLVKTPLNLGGASQTLEELGRNKRVKRNGPKGRNISYKQFIINEKSLNEFKNCDVDQLQRQTQNERNALNNSSLFSKLEKKFLRDNNYLPVLVDTLLLEKLARLHQSTAKKLIFTVLENLNEENKTNHFNEEDLITVSKTGDSIAIINSKKKPAKKVSIKKFLIGQIYNLLISRLIRHKERLAEILYHLLVKMCLTEKGRKATTNYDLNRVKNKMKEYANEKNVKRKKRNSKNKNCPSAGGVGKIKKKVVKSKRKTKRKVISLEEKVSNKAPTAVDDLKSGNLDGNKKEKELAIMEYIVRQLRLQSD